MHKTLVPQFETDASSVDVTLVDGQAELAIPTLSDGDPARFVMISVQTAIIGTPVTFKVGLAGVDSGTDPHGVISSNSGPLIINVTGQKAIDFTCSEGGTAYVVPLSNQ